MSLTKYQDVLLVMGCLITGHCLFLAAALARLSNKYSNILLACWLILLAVRTAKSVLGLVYQPINYGINIVGIIAMALIGPVFLFCIRSINQPTLGISKKESLHLIPSVLLVGSFPFLSWKVLGAEYYIFTVIIIGYLLVTILDVFRHKSEYQTDDLKWRWTMRLLVGSSLMTISFTMQLIFYQPLIYFTNIMLATVIIYALSLWALGSSRLFITHPRKKSSNDHRLEELAARVRELMAREDIFTDSLLTLSKLASQLKAPPYLVSQAINNYFDKSFPELLLHHRIRKAESLLTNTNDNLTIEAIAYECGFNTLSAFYTAFKKVHKQTPTQYKNKLKADLKVA